MTETPYKFLFIHANGLIGSQFVPEALNKGHSVACSYLPNLGSNLQLHNTDRSQTHLNFNSCINALRNKADIENLQEWVEQNLEDMDRLVIDLSAIPSLEPVSFTHISLADWSQLIDTYLKTSFFIVQHYIQEWVICKIQGRIIFILPQISSESHPGYASLYTALIAFNRSLAKEYGLKRIYSNAIALDFKEMTTEHLNEIVGTILFLSSDESSLIDGETLHLT